MRTKILITENHDEVRKSLREWLSVTFRNCDFLEASTGEEAVALACEHKPDVVLMDISMPGIDGIEATRRIKAAVPTAQVVIVTVHEEEAYRLDAQRAGASAYVQKAQAPTRLVSALESVLQRESAI